jgi:hypothetical protein
MMSIKDFTEKIKSFWVNNKDKIYSQENGLKIKDDLFVVFLIFLVGMASFGLGKISSLEKRKVPISILNTQESMYASVSESIQTNKKVGTKEMGTVVASKSGTKYYYPWCSGVARIKEENKV